MDVLRRSATVVLAVASSLEAAPGAKAPSEFEVKAAFLCSFSEYVDWPGELAEGPVRIGILGKDPFGALLEATAKERPIQSRPLEILRLSEAREGRACHIVFIASSEKAALPAHLEALEGANVLTVSDLESFVARRGMIGFFLENRRVRFEVDPLAAERAGLRISSHLLRLGRVPAAVERKG